jgi:hypothetical protein
MLRIKNIIVLATTFFCFSCSYTDEYHNENTKIKDEENTEKWLAGDHHIHSIYSVKWNEDVTPPEPMMGSDGIVSTEENARMGYKHGLSWMVTTDHGGPNHSKFNLTQAYPALVESRKSVPNIIQFYGMEFDVPGAEHASLIIPKSKNESNHLYAIEKNYARKDTYPYDSKRDDESYMLEALEYMSTNETPPLVIVNHPGRTASGLGIYTKVTPTELRNWNDIAPNIAIGMVGSPGHQARTLKPNGDIKIDTPRGYKAGFSTMGGFDQMSAILGGFWDSMLGEGRHWWITAVSDSHGNYKDDRSDFWPGEYSKTYVYSKKNYNDILDNLRNGHIFVTTGDLITELYVTLRVNNKVLTANIGDTLVVNAGDTINVEIKFLDPESNNANSDNPKVNHVDLIGGKVMGVLKDKSVDSNPTTQVIQRFYEDDWEKHQQHNVINYVIKNIIHDSYIRVRGTNTGDLEPDVDKLGENPWLDLWFYSNPIFIQVK